jgi:hypothetical protein
MGTRSLTIVKKSDLKSNNCVVMYRQYDGYVQGGHGEELYDFLKNKSLVNGFGSGDNSNYFNGMGCLSAALVANFKQGIGGIYLHATDNSNYIDYVYTIYTKNDTDILVKIERGDNIIYDGDINNMLSCDD